MSYVLPHVDWHNLIIFGSTLKHNLNMSSAGWNVRAPEDTRWLKKSMERFYIDMFVSTNYPGLCLGHSVTLSVWPKFPLIGQLNEREDILVSSV